jgi:hypothetical protein
MPSKKPATKEQKAFRFYNTAAGHLVLSAIIWFIGFNLFLLATDTGSLLQWGGVLISLFWGLYHFIIAVQMFIKKAWQKASKNS